MKRKPTLDREFAQFVQVRRVGSRIQLGSDHNHRLFGHIGLKEASSCIDNFEIVDRIAIVDIAHVHEMRDQPGAFDVLQKSCAEPGALVRALDQSWHVGHDERATLSRHRRPDRRKRRQDAARAS